MSRTIPTAPPAYTAQWRGSISTKEIFHLIRSGDAAQLEGLLRGHPEFDINFLETQVQARDDGKRVLQRTALGDAIYRQKKNVIAYLLSFSDISLDQVVTYPKVQALDLEANLDPMDFSHREITKATIVHTPLTLAITLNLPEVVIALLEKGASPNCRPIPVGSGVNSPRALERKMHAHAYETPLSLAIKHKMPIPVIQMLVVKGAKIDAVTVSKIDPGSSKNFISEFLGFLGSVSHIAAWVMIGVFVHTSLAFVSIPLFILCIAMYFLAAIVKRDQNFTPESLVSELPDSQRKTQLLDALKIVPDEQADRSDTALDVSEAEADPLVSAPPYAAIAEARLFSQLGLSR